MWWYLARNHYLTRAWAVLGAVGGRRWHVREELHEPASSHTGEKPEPVHPLQQWRLKTPEGLAQQNLNAHTGERPAVALGALGCRLWEPLVLPTEPGAIQMMVQQCNYNVTHISYLSEHALVKNHSTHTGHN